MLFNIFRKNAINKGQLFTMIFSIIKKCNNYNERKLKKN